MSVQKINRDLSRLVAQAASEKKARDIIILNMEGISFVTDHFLICSAPSTTQVKAISDNIEEKLKEQGVQLLHKEGYQTAHWILMDYGTCVAHIFVEEDRRFYNLEQLWGDAETVYYED